MEINPSSSASGGLRRASKFYKYQKNMVIKNIRINSEAIKFIIEKDGKVAGRAYGDVMAFDKIVKANNIQNPDLIEPGTVLSIPR